MQNASNVPQAEVWLSLQDAANRLNVHAATLRRWADSGDLPHMLTPGGHRRFAVSDLEKFAGDRRVQQRKVSLPEAWAAKAITHTRQEMPAADNTHWMSTLSDAARAQHRALGQRLMGLTLQFISADDGEHLLTEARAIGTDYGLLSRQFGVPMTDALQAALYFRDKLLEATLDLSKRPTFAPATTPGWSSASTPCSTLCNWPWPKCMMHNLRWPSRHTAHRARRA